MADIFISYAHSDNAFPRYDSKGWIDRLQAIAKANLLVAVFSPAYFEQTGNGR
jgi:hypothetical protein